MGTAAVMCDLHDVVDPRGHPGLGQHLPQHHRLQRGERRGLVHEGVAAGEGGGHLQYGTVQYSTVQYSTASTQYLPGAGLQGVVPGPHPAHHAQRLPGGVAPAAAWQPHLQQCSRGLG